MMANHLDAGDGMLLRQTLEDKGQLLVGEDLHMVLRRMSEAGQDLRDLLGGKVEVLRHLMHSVFFHTQI